MRCRVKTECNGTRAESRFGLPAKRTSPFMLLVVFMLDSDYSPSSVTTNNINGLFVSLEDQICFLRVCHYIPFLLYYQQHKWARSFRWKTKSAFCACAIHSVFTLPLLV